MPMLQWKRSLGPTLKLIQGPSEWTIKMKEGWLGWEVK